MKNLFNKKISAFILSVLLLAAFLIPAAASADTEAESGQQEAHPPRLVDDADLLLPEEEAALLSELDRISSEQGVDVVIVTVNSTNGKTPEAYADDYFDYNGYGLGKDRSGALFLRSLDPQKVHISTSGKAIKYFTDSNIESIYDAIEVDIPGDYAAAFRTFASYAEDDIITGKKNSHLNLYHIIIALVIGFFVSGIPMNAMKKALTSVGKKTEAQDYVVKDSLQIANASDLFLYRNVIRTEIPRENKGGGGSSTHISSSGRTHGGGGRSM